MITIITPWLNHPELIPGYKQATEGAHVIVIDNGSDEVTHKALLEAGFTVIRNEFNNGYSRANNQGLEIADDGLVVFLNNDVVKQGDWLSIIENLKPGALYGASSDLRYVDGVPVFYIEGWCLIGHKSDFVRIGGWKNDWKGLYWEDNELCWRASRAGLGLKQINLPLQHLSNYTSSRTPDAYAHRSENQREFERIVREDRNG